MLHKSFKPAKCKTSLKLAIPRIRLLKNKKDVHIKQFKGELAKLLEAGQDQTARIRVEHVMREVRTKEAYELIEIYCELIVARMPIIESQKNCPLDLKEAVTSVIFASPRCADIPELMEICKQFTAKYGKEFTSAAAELRPECGVNCMLVDKLSARAPDGLTKMKILSAIAEEYNVKWESKVFEEKVSMPSTDLLNGPRTSGRIQMEPIQMEPIEVQVPVYHDYKEPHNIQFPSKPDKNHNKPAVYKLQNPVSAPHSQKSSSSNITINAGTYNPEVRRPEIDDAKTEFRHSSFSGENWNMEFKDATSAAQAAAESAERASMAARAAAELASLGKIAPQRSSNSLNSSVYKLKEEKHQEFSHLNLPNEHIPNDPLSTAAYGGSWMRGEPSYKDAKISSADNDWDTKKWINDKPLADKSDVADKYPEMMSSEPWMNNPLGRSTLEPQFCKSEADYVSEQPDVVEAESGLNIGVVRIGKESCPDDVVLDDKKSVSEAGENPFASDDLDQDGVVVFDESTSDDNYDMVSKDQTREYGFNPLSPDRKPLKNSSSLPNPWDPIRIKSEEPPLFSESPSSTGPSQIDNLLPMTFDLSDGPSSESEEEIEKSKLNQDSGKYFFEQNVDFINPERNQKGSFRVERSSEEENYGYGDSPRAINSFLDVNQSGSYGSPKSSEDKKSDYSDSPEVVKSNLNVSNDAVDKEWAQKASRISLHNEVTDNIYRGGSLADSQNSEESSLESVNELNFMNLRGGFRNQKPYTRPPYVKSLTGKDSENSDRKIETKPTPVPSSSFGHNGESQVWQKPSLRVPARSAQNVDDPDDEFADHHKSSINIATEVIEKTTAEVANKYVDPHNSDSEEDLSIQTSNKPRPNIGVPRRTKGTSLNTGSPSKSPSTPEYVNERIVPTGRSPEPFSTNEAQSSFTTSENVRSEEQLRQFATKELSKIIPESRSSEDENLKLSAEEQPSISLPKMATEKTIDSLNSSRGETPSSGKSAHVHPKLPDYDSFAAHFLSLRKNG